MALLKSSMDPCSQAKAQNYSGKSGGLNMPANNALCSTSAMTTDIPLPKKWQPMTSKTSSMQSYQEGHESYRTYSHPQNDWQLWCDRNRLRPVLPRYCEFLWDCSQQRKNHRRGSSRWHILTQTLRKYHQFDPNGGKSSKTMRNLCLLFQWSSLHQKDRGEQRNPVDWGSRDVQTCLPFMLLHLEGSKVSPLSESYGVELDFLERQSLEIASYSDRCMIYEGYFEIITLSKKKYYEMNNHVSSNQIRILWCILDIRKIQHTLYSTKW